MLLWAALSYVSSRPKIVLADWILFVCICFDFFCSIGTLLREPGADCQVHLILNSGFKLKAPPNVSYGCQGKVCMICSLWNWKRLTCYTATPDQLPGPHRFRASHGRNSKIVGSVCCYYSDLTKGSRLCLRLLQRSIYVDRNGCV